MAHQLLSHSKKTTFNPIPSSRMCGSATLNFKGSTPFVNRKGTTQEKGTTKNMSSPHTEQFAPAGFGVLGELG